jgi:hypothetical protein
MQFSNIFTLLAVAMTATALPAADNSNAVAPRTGGSCHTHQKQVCCNGILTCLVTILGASCSGKTYCCETSSGPVSIPCSLHGVGLCDWDKVLTTVAQGTIVNVALLNCVDLL